LGRNLRHGGEDREENEYVATVCHGFPFSLRGGSGPPFWLEEEYSATAAAKQSHEHVK
jgi:hypothetical protein